MSDLNDKSVKLHKAVTGEALKHPETRQPHLAYFYLKAGEKDDE